MKKLALALLILVFCAAAYAEPYRLIVIPDTQFASEKWPHLLTATSQWILKNQKPLNIRYVLQVGDMVQNATVEEEWKRFDENLGLLDGKVPYLAVLGNHDMVLTGGKREAKLFEKHFPPERFAKLPSFPTGAADKANSYRTFSAGGTDWLIVGMPFAPTDAELEGANRVVAAHPERRVIVVTHAYLKQKGRGDEGERIWQKLVKRYPNIAIVFCGHVGSLTPHFASQGEQGNTVYEMMFDWQNENDEEKNGYLAILEFDPEAATISVKSYSPHLDQYMAEPKCHYEIHDVDFLRPGSKAMQPAAVGGRP
jgi:predicted MPP superfamily phosphohydrolase